MSFKYYFFIILMIISLKGKAQILLNWNLSQIKTQVALQGGKLTQDIWKKSNEGNRYYRKIIFQFPSPPEGNECLISMTFYFSAVAKCFKYDETYWGKDIAIQRIDEINRYCGKLNRFDDSSKWINNEKNFEVNLISEKVGPNKLPSVYILEIMQVDRNLKL